MTAAADVGRLHGKLDVLYIRNCICCINLDAIEKIGDELDCLVAAATFSGAKMVSLSHWDSDYFFFSSFSASVRT